MKKVNPPEPGYKDIVYLTNRKTMIWKLYGNNPDIPFIADTNSDNTFYDIIEQVICDVYYDGMNEMEVKALKLVEDLA